MRWTETSRSGSRNGRGCNRARLSALEMAVVAPMPSPRHRIAQRLTVGERLRLRAAWRISVQTDPMVPPVRDASSTAGSGGEFRRSVQRFLAHEDRHDGLLDVQPVLGLVPDAALGAVDDGGAHFLAPMRRQAVEKDRVSRGTLHERLIHT